MSGPPTTPLELNDEIVAVFDLAISERSAPLLASVSPDGKPMLSYRGSARPYSATQIGLWFRHAEGDTITAVQKNANVVVLVRSSASMLQFHGRIRVTQDAAERDQVYTNAPEMEQKADAERKGAALIVDVDRIEGVLRRTPEGPVFLRMARDA